jgi:hypothetical protein
LPVLWQAEGLNDAAIGAFKYNLGVLTSGANLMIPESDIQPVDELPDYDKLTDTDAALLAETVMVKLNGGLGTGMGLEKAKSLLNLKDGMTFLDFIAKQVIDMREANGMKIAFVLMNSFATSADTLAHLETYGDKIATDNLSLEFQQNKVRAPARVTTPSLSTHECATRARAVTLHCAGAQGDCRRPQAGRVAVQARVRVVPARPRRPVSRSARHRTRSSAATPRATPALSP